MTTGILQSFIIGIHPRNAPEVSSDIATGIFAQCYQKNFQVFLLAVFKGISGISACDNSPAIPHKFVQRFLKEFNKFEQFVKKTSKKSLEKKLQKICRDLLRHPKRYFWWNRKSDLKKKSLYENILKEILKEFLKKSWKELPKKISEEFVTNLSRNFSLNFLGKSCINFVRHF